MEAVQAAGKVIGGIGSYEQGKYNRAASQNEATMAERDGASQELMVRERARAAIGAQVAAQGANGFHMGTGSAIDALAESQIAATLDAMTARRNAALDARSKRAQGAIAYAAGSNAMVQGMLMAGSDVMGMKTDWAAAKTGVRAPGKG